MMYTMVTRIVSTRIEENKVKEIEKFAKAESLDKSSFLNKLLNKSLEEYKTEYAFKLYKEGKISLGRASEIAEKSLWEMIDLLKKYDAFINYSIYDLEKDIANIK